MGKVNLNNISFQQLMALVHTVEEGTMSRAAKKMHLTQPSLTKHIQNLEEMVGTTLLLRGKKGVSLTPEGRLLFNAALKILRLMDETAVRLDRMIEGDEKEIMVGASTVPSVYILPRLISRFRAAYPKMIVTVVGSDSGGIVEMVEEGDLPFGFVGYRPLSARLVGEAIWPDYLILVASPRLVSPTRTLSGYSCLQELPFIIREKGSGTREIAERWMKEKAHLDFHRLNIVACFGSSEAVKEAVLSGIGVSFLSRRVVERELNLGLLKEIRLPGEGIKRDFYLIYRKSQVFLSYQRMFLDYVRSTVGGELGE
ncbi:MAG: LysR substrate-binding domain-containing protein [Syntrophales bacterium]|nr:LysR substrate-binding domain-containing protein [Syntrophales bacterium]